MLIKCPECELQVSDKAISCPHCGYPMQTEPKTTRRKRSNKRRRLPNGFGQISEVKGGNLRNRYRAMITIGKTEEGKPICKLLKPKSYFETYNEAYEALVEYNRNPYDFKDDITVRELYDKWTDVYFPKITPSSRRTEKAAWSYCSSVYNMRVKDLRAKHIKHCIDEGFVSVNGEIRMASLVTKSRIKTLFNKMLDYAVEYELVEKNYARTFALDREIVKKAKSAQHEHMAFDSKEMKKLWNNIDKYDYIDMMIIQCYSGWRPAELCELKLENVNLEEDYFIGGSKTDAGKNRKVPIHSRIKPIVEKRYEQAKTIESEYLFNCMEKNNPNERKMTYSKYASRFAKIVKELNLNPEHRAHDGRKHFITEAKKYNADEFAIKYIVGHEITDITEKIYTEREFSWLKSEMEKIE